MGVIREAGEQRRHGGTGHLEHVQLELLQIRTAPACRVHAPGRGPIMSHGSVAYTRDLITKTVSIS
jgi:hypothetical protein